MNALRRAAALALLLPALVPAAARAQSPSDRGILLYSGVEFRSLSFDAGLGVGSVSQLALPLAAYWTASPRLSFDAGIRYASVTREPEAGDTTGASEISGLTDFQVRAVYQAVPDVVVLTLAANLPTGRTELTSDELPAAGAVASDLIPFPVTSFGQGSNLTAGVAVAVPVADWAMGLGASYRLSGEFTPLAAVDSSYRPGGEIRLRLGADRLVGQGRISLGITFSTFAEDEFGGSRIFQPGNRVISQASWSFPVGNTNVALYAWDVYRTGGTVAISARDTEKQNVLAAGASAAIQMGRRVLRPQVEFRRHTAGLESLEAAGQMLSLSARYQMPLGERLVLLPALRFDTGNVVSNGLEVGFSGWGLSLGLRADL